MGIFDNAVSVVINNKVVQSIKTLNGGVLYEKGNGTFLTIDVPLNIVYSDAFNISGTLKDSNMNGLSGETVKLKVGNTVVDSTTTTTGGAYSFTQTPVTTGNHSFQVIYEGSSTYNASESTVVNRVVGKETTVLSVTSPVNNYMTYDTSITFAGTLTDDDGTVLTDKTIKIKEGNNTVNTTTTDSNGAFSIGLYSVSVGTHNFSIVYEGDSNYTASSVSRSVIVREHDYAISISADKPILSYSDGETATVTALLTDNSVLVSGETLSYTVKHGATVLDSGSDVTDSNGEISFTYQSAGVGDVTVEVSFGIILQEIYAIEDCWKYDDTTYTGSSSSPVFNLNYSLPSNYVLTYEDYHSASYGFIYLNFGVDDTHRVALGTVEHNYYEMYVQNNQSWSNKTVINAGQSEVTNQWVKHTVTVENGQVTFKNATTSNTSQIDLTLLRNFVARQSTQLRNIKVKAL